LLNEISESVKTEKTKSKPPGKLAWSENHQNLLGG